MTNRIGCICIALGLLVTMADTADAQYRRPFQIVPRVSRALGAWNGPGYHTCNPGPDVSYYNPWTAKNSTLISNSPEFLSRYGHEINPTPMDLLRSGRDAFGQPLYGGGQDEYVPSSTPFNADFVPNRREEEEEDEDDNFEDELEDFGEEEFDAEDELEDRFDEEADAFEEQSESLGDESDAADQTEPGSSSRGSSSRGSSTQGSSTRESDVQDSSSDEAFPEDETTLLLEPGGLFLPASHSGN